MEARLEVLERGFEGLLALRKTLLQNVEEERRERMEIRRQLQAMTETVHEISARTISTTKKLKGAMVLNNKMMAECVKKGGGN
jgi:hypothetical protein